MENEHVIVAEESSPKTGNRLKKILIVIFALIVLIATAGLSYFLGTRRRSPEEIFPTPTQTLTSPTETPSLEQASSQPTPTASKGKEKPTSTPSPTPTPTVKTKKLSSISSLDGFRSSNGGGNSTLEIRAGRNVNLVTRGFLSFDLAAIASGATIVEANLRLYQAQIVGKPYAVGGDLKLDHLTYGDSLDDSDYGLAALSSSFTTIAKDTKLEWKEAKVTNQLKDDISNGRSLAQFRIHFQTENTGGDVAGDFAYFEAAENSMRTGNTPQLVVKYY